MQNIGIQLQLPEELSGHLVRQCQAREGARHLRRLVQEQVEGPASEYLLRTGKKISKMKGIMENGTLRFQ